MLEKVNKVGASPRKSHCLLTSFTPVLSTSQLSLPVYVHNSTFHYSTLTHSA